MKPIQEFFSGSFEKKDLKNVIETCKGLGASDELLKEITSFFERVDAGCVISMKIGDLKKLSEEDIKSITKGRDGKPPSFQKISKREYFFSEHSLVIDAVPGGEILSIGIFMDKK